MAEEKNKGALDWDSTIENEGTEKKFELLPEGEYRFGVKEMEKSHSENKHCPMARLTIGIFAIDDPDFTNELASVKDQLVLHDDCEWKICEFFVSIGDRKHGTKHQPNWEGVPGASGKCTLIVEEFKRRDGSMGKSNKISKYLDPAPAPAEKAEPAKGNADKPNFA